MISVASGGTADRMAARSLLKVLRAGFGTRARYSSTFFGAPLFFGAELRLPDVAFFMEAMLQRPTLQVHFPHDRAAVRPERGGQGNGNNYSWRKATTGSTRVARRVGKKAAKPATRIRTIGTAM